MAGKLSGSAIQTGTITSTQLSTELGPVSSELQLVGSGISLNVSNVSYFAGNVGVGTTNPLYVLHANGSSPQVVVSGTGGSGERGIALLDNNGAKYNFFIGAQKTVNDGFEIIPSTSAGGTTFTTPALVILGSNGNVGIGTTSPSEKLHIGSGQSNYIRIHNASSGDVSSGISITRGSSLGFQIYDNPSDDTSTINAANNINIRTGSTSFRIYINGAGKVGIGTTSFNTNGGKLQVADGISFPATQSALSDPNTLDDYEEGTFTPSASSSGGTITSYTSNGYYTKIGNVVTIIVNINIATAGTASGDMNISGLPFTSANTNRRAAVALVREDNALGFTSQCWIAQNSTSATIQDLNGGSISWGNGYYHCFSATYLTA